MGTCWFPFGSSPLSRGIRQTEFSWNQRAGIIPALAGNTLASGVAAAITKDHPRSRGEYACAMTPHSRQEGSSPLSRGIPVELEQTPGSAGIIPALAGNTKPPMSYAGGKQDHPRSRGEYRTCRFYDYRDGGSSPLSRGIRGAVDAEVAGDRIIPALAGNTTAHSWNTPIKGDHPRSRGEYSEGAYRLALGAGSSPLSRGILGAMVPMGHR